jgi:putative membrane protein
MMSLFWAAVIVAIILLIRWISASGGLSKGSTKGQDSALEILKKRYARGEINKDEFEQKKKDLS